MRIHLTILAGAVFLTTLVPSADAQLLPRWFGPKTNDKNASAKAPQYDPRRMTEVNIEVAWLADPVTFPYYLEAHASSTSLEVRGYVPNKAVRDQALRIAQVYSSMPVTDAMKEHPSLLVRPSPMSPPQLQTSVTSALKVALPKGAPQLKAECGSDGKVCVLGAVATLEDKMAVSHALRRLHGCTSVQNLTTLPGELAQAERTPIITTSRILEKPVVALEPKAKPWWTLGKPVATQTPEPPLLEARTKPVLRGPIVVEVKKPELSDGPILIPSVTEPKKDVVKVELPTPRRDAVRDTPPTPLTAAELQKRIQSACPQAKSVEVEFTSAQEIRVTLELANENELQSIADRVFALPELQKIRAELQFKISAP